MANLRLWLMGTVLLAGALAGCASSGGIRIVEHSADVAPEARLVDIHTFRIKGHDEGRMKQVAREWAQRLGADTVVIRVVDRPSDQLLFSVEAYRSPPPS
jgi:hypothetical protein